MFKSIRTLAMSALLLGAVSAEASALTAKPQRVGPVQNYGVLGTQGNKIVSKSTGKEVMLRGMSMFWSDATGLQYYNRDVIKWAVDNLKMDVVRYAMGVRYYDSQGGTNGEMDKQYSYHDNPDGQKSNIDNMIQYAIENDIYIIIDWHSHRADNETSEATAFFKEMATTYKDIPNIIWEVFNEPVNQSMGTIASYANTVIGAIRNAGSKNLALVGTPRWSQMGECGGVNQTDVGYVFHFYAATHSKGSYSGNVDRCRSGGNAVFITEWGTTTADGKGGASVSASQDWETYMEQNRISNCNWSLRNEVSTIGEKTSEGSAMFAGSTFLSNTALLNGASYTTSGSHVKQYLASHGSNWADTLIAGKNVGSCAFPSARVKESASLSSVVKSGCTYTSSDEKVVSVADGVPTIVNPGFAILTGSDGSKSVIQVEEEIRQKITGFSDFACTIVNTCGSKTFKDLNGDGKFEVIASSTGLTDKGAAITFKSLNPSVVDVIKSKCTNDKFCYGQTLNSTVDMFQFSGVMGEAKIVATAPATAGFPALNDTITVSYTKGGDKIDAKNFKDQTILKTQTVTDFFSETTHFTKQAVTYTFDGEAVSVKAVRNGTDLIAADKDAIVYITASAPETEQYSEFKKTVRIVIGAGEIEQTTSINKASLKGAMDLRAGQKAVYLTLKNAGTVSVDVFSINGQKLPMSQMADLTAGTHMLDLQNLPQGSYIIRVQQGSNAQQIKWTVR